MLTVSQVRWELQLTIGFSNMVLSKREWFEGHVSNLQFQMYEDCGRKTDNNNKNPPTT